MIPIAVDDPLQLAWFHTNHDGNAERLVVLSKGLLKWVDDKFWIAFDGQRWSEREGERRARELAIEVANHIHDEVSALAELIGDPKSPDGAALAERFGPWCTPERALDRLALLSKFAIKSGNANETDGMLKQAKSKPELRAWSEDFDVDPLMYNVQNGTLRFVRGQGGKWAAQFREGHDPADMLRSIANVAYDPKATCPMWRDRLELVQPDPEQRAGFPRMYGQTLTGLTDCEEFYVHKGRGGDGKTKTHEILAHLHGDYYRDSSIKTFLQASFQKSGAEHRSDLVRLAGDIRMVVAPEPPPRSTWDGETLKAVTGGGTVTARGSGERTEITFKPRWKLFVEVNPTPKMPGDDKGFRRRFRLVQWPVDLARTEGGFESPAELRARLLSELPGILNWLIEGCLEWLADRRVPIAQVEADALADFWATDNPLGQWLSEECDLTDREAVTRSKQLLDAFKAWMERNEIEEDVQKRWNATKFGRDLGQMQVIGKKDGSGNIIRKGIRLLGPRATGLLAERDGVSAGGAAQGSPKATRDDFGNPDGWPDSGFADDDDPLGGDR